MTLHAADWSFIAKSLYKLFRPYLKSVVDDSTNTVDDTVIKVCDLLSGYSE